MTAQYSITVPDPLQEIVDLIAEQKQLSKSATIIYLIDRGLPVVIDELRKVKYYKGIVVQD